MVNQTFLDLLEQMKDIHNKKNEDYSSVGFYENFERQALISSWFKNDIDKSFANMIAVKLARLATLLGKDKSPNNESVDDSFLDLTVYCGLWASYHRNKKEEIKTMIEDHIFVFKITEGSFCNTCNQHISRHKNLP